MYISAWGFLTGVALNALTPVYKDLFFLSRAFFLIFLKVSRLPQECAMCLIVCRGGRTTAV